MPKRPTYQIAARAMPAQGAKGLPITLDFTAAGSNGASISNDLLIEMEGGDIDFIQCVFIDNSQNPGSLTLQFPGATTGDCRLIAPPFSQGYYPVNIPLGKVSVLATTGALVAVPITFYNVEFPYVVWSTLASPGGGQLLGTPIQLSATGAGPLTVTFPAVAGRTNFLAGFNIAAVATAGINGMATVTGILGGTLSFLMGVGVAPAVATTLQNFVPPLPASGPNVAITINSIAAGAGGNESVTAWGFLL